MPEPIPDSIILIRLPSSLVNRSVLKSGKETIPDLILTQLRPILTAKPKMEIDIEGLEFIITISSAD